MKLKLFLFSSLVVMTSVSMTAASKNSMAVLTMQELQDKIAGGWAAQTIGCAFGGPWEFRYQGKMIAPETDLKFSTSEVKQNMLHNPGLYDDIYMDLTFVEVIERFGLNAPADSFATAFAYAKYPLWHANQSGRYNVIRGIYPPRSGYWKENPHADCIDYQIESDYAGLMSPGMPNAASAISDKVGHIMNYGDGWYGGVFVGAMYTQAFLYNDIEKVITEALRTIPVKSKFHKVISSVIDWYHQHPDDWRATWQLVQNHYSTDIGCPDGVFNKLNIDATLNCAYVIMGLLYGGGDLTKTADVATRCGQDADCNPSTACGILGCMLGYSHMPEFWRKSVEGCEDINFQYTDISLSKVYKLSLKHALMQVKKNGGKVEDDKVYIKVQKPKPVRFEQSFKGLTLSKAISLKCNVDKVPSTRFEGKAILLQGSVRCKDPNYKALVDVVLDGKVVTTLQLVRNAYTANVDYLYYNYDLKAGNHTISFRWQNPDAKAQIYCNRFIVYK